MVEKANGGRRLVATVGKGLAGVVVASYLAACQEDRRDAAAHAMAPLETVSLYGVRVGMTPEDLEAAFPGLHCSPTPEHPACTLPSSVPGTGAIDVAFRDGHIVSAKANVETGQGKLGIRSQLEAQLGPPQGYTEDFTGNAWQTRDGVELQLKENISSFGTTTSQLVLATADERARWTAEKAHEREAAVATVGSVLAEVLRVAPDGRIEVCGLRVGTRVDGPISCSSATHMKVEVAGAKGCPLGRVIPWTEPPPCLIASRLQGTNQISDLSVTVPVESADVDALRGAMGVLPNGEHLRPSEHNGLVRGMTRPWYIYDGSDGDVLVVTPLGLQDTDPRAGAPGTITIAVRGKGVDEAVFR